MSVTIYHNPRCSKSRQTLALLQEKGIEPVVVEYLKTPPDAATLQQLLNALDMPATKLARRKEARDLGLGDADDTAMFQAMQEHPVLIERPIVVNGDKARLGRPPEQVLEIL